VGDVLLDLDETPVRDWIRGQEDFLEITGPHLEHGIGPDSPARPQNQTTIPEKRGDRGEMKSDLLKRLPAPDAGIGTHVPPPSQELQPAKADHVQIVGQVLLRAAAEHSQTTLCERGPDPIVVRTRVSAEIVAVERLTPFVPNRMLHEIQLLFRDLNLDTA
jgi:hypothetical protein